MLLSIHVVYALAMYEPIKPLVILYPGGVVEYLSKSLTITEDISCLYRRRLYCDADSPGQTADTGQSTLN